LRKSLLFIYFLLVNPGGAGFPGGTITPYPGGIFLLSDERAGWGAGAFLSRGCPLPLPQPDAPRIAIIAAADHEALMNFPNFIVSSPAPD
jgi:hypothetical protein